MLREGLVGDLRRGSRMEEQFIHMLLVVAWVRLSQTSFIMTRRFSYMSTSNKFNSYFPKTAFSKGQIDVTIDVFHRGGVFRNIFFAIS